MKFSGNNTLSISQQTNASFLVDISLDNINGLCNLVFTGVNENVNFKFTNGKIFDPENKLIYTNVKEVSFMIFRTGSVLIVGKCDENVLMLIYEFLKVILNNEYKNF